jgi:outer membrane lipoprotein carrier protein
MLEMKRRPFVLFLLAGAVLAVLPSSSATAAPDDGLTARKIAARVQEFYDKTQVFKAGFKQRYWIKAHNKAKHSQGQVIFKKPGKMSWRYSNNGNRVVSDGKIVKVYEKDKQQMYEQKINKSQYPAALSFLVGGGNLLKSFKLRKLNSKRMQYEGGWVLEGVPRTPTPAYQKLLLYVDAKTHQVRRVLLLDAQGNRNRFDFVSPSVNHPAPKDEFDFKPPRGTQVIKP